MAAVLGATAGFIALDPVEAHYFRTTSTYRGFNHVFTSNATGIGIVVAPVCPGCLYQWTETVCLHCHQIEVSLV